jgi:hypothetical protein
MLVQALFQDGKLLGDDRQERPQRPVLPRHRLFDVPDPVQRGKQLEQALDIDSHWSTSSCSGRGSSVSSSAGDPVVSPGRGAAAGMRASRSSG